ncbi:MAG: hypothetical protein UT84_C0005G0015 [Candidatus Curtissbacteria bacterium GW2011_GWA1_40_16]|uniref:SCP domain-containing protein n=1 Tax=Candidatus Curtissbacteria bacterium GW2011_GWA1_40_16 TaxID=1618405 RepID=A0A0G0RDT1_9BACT|nr:MAG: hypothetical protein UT84_C0005G0015 [Candidatus Curtissbacteria bacterium GW2011_GWA1_40_16]
MSINCNCVILKSVIHRKLARHFIPHHHEDGEQHHAHALTLPALFAYFQIFVFLIAGLYFVKVRAPQVLGVASFSAQEIISLTNARRVQNGLGPLVYNGQLATAAAAKAQDMFTVNYWAHNSPLGKTPWSFITAAGYKYVYAGENLARDFNDAGSVVGAWMNSPSHRENILDSNFKEIGVAVADGKLTGTDGILVVQMFGTPVAGVPTTPTLAQTNPTPVPTPAPGGQAAGQQVAVVPSPTPTVTPIPIAIVNPIENVNLEPVSGPGSQATVLASRQFSISRIATLVIVGFIFLLFALEVLFVVRRDNLELRPGVVAHLGMLGFVLLVIWYAVEGAII